MSLKEIKDELINFYISIKIRKREEINTITEEELDKEKESLEILTTLEIINYISNTINAIIDKKASEKFEYYLSKEEEKKYYRNKENQEDKNGLILYESMLISAESQIRRHISVRKKYILHLIF